MKTYASALKNRYQRANRDRMVPISLVHIGYTFVKGVNMTAICKWGNSFGLRLPKSVMQEAGLKSGSEVGVRLLDDGSILITPRKGKIVVNENHSMAQANPPEVKW